MIIAATVVAVLVGGGLWYATAPKAEHLTAPSETGIAASGARLADVAVPDLIEGRAKMGETAFNAKCAVCHGTDAAGQQGVAPPLVHKIYEPGHHGDGAFLNAVTNGVRAHHWPFGNMPRIEGLTKAEVANIVAYIRLLQRENGIR